MSDPPVPFPSSSAPQPAPAPTVSVPSTSANPLTRLIPRSRTQSLNSPASSPVATGDIMVRSGGSASLKGLGATGIGGGARKGWAAGRARGEKAQPPQDPKYKKYTQQVERSLAAFLDVQEWADFIAFLTRLLKTFQAYPQFDEIPRKLTVSKRLAQCLNPALPTGVHQRALDVYAQIFSVIGVEGLRRDLQVWSSGLFPFFQYAATSVKPALLSIYEKYYFPLQESLRPVMKAFILALLPGLEEETGEFFDPVLRLLDYLSGTVNPAFFLQNLFLVLLTSPTARIPALNFLSRRFPKLRGDEDITVFVGSDIGLMIRGFAASLEDDQLLVRRAALELLVTSLRLSSDSFKRDTQPGDRVLLMKTAAGVVLRRDLSLNRRLYAWLLGADDSPDAQIAHLRTHGLDLLRQSLLDDMLSPSSADPAERTRPYKVFISLLDKWEVGYPLTEVLVLDVLRVLERELRDVDEDDELLMTASMLVESVDLHTTWRKLYGALKADFEKGEGDSEAIRIIRFIVRRFGAKDEELHALHLPLALFALLSLVEQTLSSPSADAYLPLLSEALQLARDLLHVIPRRVLHQRPPTIPSSPASPLSLADEYYAPGDTRPPAPTLDFSLFGFAFALLVRVSRAAATAPERVDVFEGAVRLLTLLVWTLEKADGDDVVEVRWEPKEWLDAMLEEVKAARDFETVETVVESFIALASTPVIEPSLSLDDRPTVTALIESLFTYLRPFAVPYHVRAVDFIWAIEHLTSHHHVESTIARRLTSPEPRARLDAYEEFGTLWRLTDEALVPGRKLTVPIFLLLDTLQDEDIPTRRAGETWMRCNLKSYLRVVDPIITALLDRRILRTSTVSSYAGREIRGLAYERAFDQARVNYMLDGLFSLIKFGGHGFSRVAKSTPLKLTSDGELPNLVQGGGFNADGSYLEALVDLLLTFLQSEPSPPLLAQMGALNARTQSIAIDVLQSLVARGEIDAAGLHSIESVVLGRLFICVHTSNLDQQHKLLHLLHTVLSTSSAARAASRRRETPGPGDGHLGPNTGASDTASIVEPEHARPRQRLSAEHINPLFVQTLLDGVSRPSNRPVLQHWIDFLLLTFTHFRHALQTLLFPLNECLCRQLREALADMVRTYAVADGDAKEKDKGKRAAASSRTTDSEFLMLLAALERVAILCQTEAATASVPDYTDAAAEKVQADGVGLLPFLNVFGSDAPAAPLEEASSLRLAALRTLNDVVRVLYGMWLLSTRSKRVQSGAASQAAAYIYSRIMPRCRKVLERLYETHAPELLESIVENWFAGDSWPMDPAEREAGTFEIIDILAPNAQAVVGLLSQSIALRSSGADRTRRLTLSPTLTDAVVFRFLEAYFVQLEGPIAVQVWGTFFPFARDVAANASARKMQIFPTLRCFIALGDKICQSRIMDDKRARRDFQDVFTKLADACILITGRSFETSTWMRRSAIGKDVVNGDDSPSTLSEAAASAVDEKDSGVASKAAWGVELIGQIERFLATALIPHLRRFLHDGDKIATICGNVIYYVVAPSLRNRTRSLEVEPVMVDILLEMIKIPASLKAWRTQVADAFADMRFFNAPPSASQQWKPLVHALLTSEKERLLELIGKVSAAPSANIFANREYEMLTRALNLRRLSFVIFAGDKNHYLLQLPSIQEKLVEVVRTTSVAPTVQSEVYLCLRVLLCRISPQNLTSFWPIILTELLRLFETLMEEQPADGSDFLGLVLSACKLLDVLLVLQTEDFQIYQSLFVTDTVDAVYPPEGWEPQAIMDRIAEIVSEHADPAIPLDLNPSTSLSRNPSTTTTATAITAPLRRPLLAGVRSIERIGQLASFFSQISLASYESVYASSGVDWEAVERGIELDFFEG